MTNIQPMKGTILFAEDDRSLAFMVKDALEDEGYKVIHCADGQTAVDSFDKAKVDICLLDIMMPNKDGYSVAKKIRQQTDRLPIIFLSTKSQESDKLKGYDTGADDYLAKPFSMAELLRKIDVFIRRTKKPSAEGLNEIHIGNIRFDPANMKIITPEETISITQKENDLLKFFCDHRNKVLKRNEVLLNVWGKEDFFLGRSMDVFVSKLRKYLKQDSSILLETIHGVGFRLSVPKDN